MKSIYDAQVAQSRLNYVKGPLLASKLQHEQNYSENVVIRKRNWEICLAMLAAYAANDAVRAWFVANDLKALRQAAYCSGALERVGYLTADPSQYGAGGE